MKKTVSVVAAVIYKDGRILATQRGYGDQKGFWEFPGGKIESGETSEEALVREIKEELLLDINVEEYITTVECDYPKFHLSMKCYNGQRRIWGVNNQHSCIIAQYFVWSRDTTALSKELDYHLLIDKG